MSDKYFFDTNIFVYSFDDRQPEKKLRSLSLISNILQTGTGMISWQVIQEFINVATRKFIIPLKPEGIKGYVLKVLHPICQVFPDMEVYEMAIDVLEKTGYSFYDSLIIAGALRGKCTILYSEDLRNGHQVDSVTIVNPFC